MIELEESYLFQVLAFRSLKLYILPQVNTSNKSVPAELAREELK